MLASRWRRLGGAFIDGIIAMVTTFPLMKALGLWRTNPTEHPFTLTENVILFFLGLGLFLAINGYLLAKHGHTVGKRLMRTRTVGVTDEAILPLPRLMALRVLPLWLVNYIPAVGTRLVIVDALFIFRSDKRCVHDLIAGTKVVNA